MNSLVQIGLANAVAAGGLAVFAALAGKLFRRPALTHALWLLVLLKLVTPPLILIPVGIPEPSDDGETPFYAQAEQPFDFIEPQLPPVGPDPEPDPRPPNPVVDPVEPPPAVKQDAVLPPMPMPAPVPMPLPVEEPQELPRISGLEQPVEPTPTSQESLWTIPDLPWFSILGWVWLIGSILWFMIALRRVADFHRVLRMGRAAPEALQRQACELAGRMGLSDCPVVWLVPGTVSPLLWAVVGYPKLLLPAALLTRLDEIQRDALLAHELAHYRRRDHWVRFLEFAALGLYWWCPIAWWARRELREAEEECCDGWVLWTLPRAAKAYADALVETLDFLSGTRPALPPVASGLGQLDLLRRRLTMIMCGKTRKNLGGLSFLAVLGLGVLLLPTLPSWAQQAPPDPVSDPVPQSAAKAAIAQKSADMDRARAELERAMAELEQLRAKLRSMQTDLELKTMTLQQAKDQLKRVEQSTVKKKDEVKQGTIKKKDQKDVIVGGFGPGMPPMNRDQIKKLLESLDGKAREEQIKILLKSFEKGAGGKGGLAVQPLVTPPAIAVAGGGAKRPDPTVPPKAPGVPPKGGVVAMAGGGGDFDKRLANLEWKVDQILREIMEMRGGGGAPKAPFPKDGKKGKKGGDFEPPTPPNPPIPPTFGGKGGKGGGAAGGQGGGGGGAKSGASGQSGGGGGGDPGRGGSFSFNELFGVTTKTTDTQNTLKKSNR